MVLETRMKKIWSRLYRNIELLLAGLDVANLTKDNDGNKGVVTEIVPTEEMPVTSDGVRAEIILNPLGVWNRLNPSQLQEQYLNFMADHVVKLMKEKDDYLEKEELFFSFLKAVNKEEYDFFDIEFMGMNRQERRDFLDKVESDGIYIHQPPFFGNTTEEQFKEIFKEHPEWCTEYDFEGIERPMTMGDVYFIRLILAFFSLIAGNPLRLS